MNDNNGYRPALAVNNKQQRYSNLSKKVGDGIFFTIDEINKKEIKRGKL